MSLNQNLNFYKIGIQPGGNIDIEIYIKKSWKSTQKHLIFKKIRRKLRSLKYQNYIHEIRKDAKKLSSKSKKS